MVLVQRDDVLVGEEVVASAGSCGPVCVGAPTKRFIISRHQPKQSSIAQTRRIDLEWHGAQEEAPVP